MRHPSAPFSEAKQPKLTSKLFWAQVLAYRPLFLLGGLWFAMVCVSAVAYNRLMFTEPPPVVAEAAPLARAEVVPSRLPQASPGEAADASDPLAEAEAESAPRLGAKVTLWGLVSLVGLCALGCGVISQQTKVMGRPKRRLKKAPPPVAKPVGPKRLAPYSADRDGVIVRGAQAVNEDPSYVAKAAPQTAAASVAQPPVGPGLGRVALPFRPEPAIAPTPTQPPLAQPQSGSSSALPQRPVTPAMPASPEPYQPTVLPEGEPHPLDWPEASLAHTLDLRQHRSLSSWM